MTGQSWSTHARTRRHKKPGVFGWHGAWRAVAERPEFGWLASPPHPSPAPVEPWPADLNALLRRVATAFEWTRQDVADFVAWARRSPEGLADARAFLAAECEKLPGLIERLTR